MLQVTKLKSHSITKLGTTFSIEIGIKTDTR